MSEILDNFYDSMDENLEEELLSNSEESDNAEEDPTWIPSQSDLESSEDEMLAGSD